jgi:hypothetical protein
MQLRSESSVGLFTDSGRDLPLPTRQSLLMHGCGGVAILQDRRYKLDGQGVA